jgi:hypothetical protein
MMSIAKAAPKGLKLKDHKCEKITFVNTIQFLMSPRKTVFRRQCLPSRLRVSRHRLAKVWNFEFLSGTLGCAKLFSFRWDLL